MARATYRQRPDGVFQIVRHGRWRRAAVGTLPMLAAFTLVVAFSAAIMLYMVIALPVLAGGAFWLLKRARRQPARQPEPPASLHTRTAALYRLRDAGP